MIINQLFHISLSKTFFLNLHQIDSFNSQLKEIIILFKTFSYRVDTSKIHILSNEKCDKHFYVFMIKNNMLNLMIDSINELFTKHNLP